MVTIMSGNIKKVIVWKIHSSPCSLMEDSEKTKSIRRNNSSPQNCVWGLVLDLKEVYVVYGGHFLPLGWSLMAWISLSSILSQNGAVCVYVCMSHL